MRVNDRENRPSHQELESYNTFQSVLLLLDALDKQLLKAIQSSRPFNSESSSLDAFRGLCTTQSDAESMLDRRRAWSVNESRDNCFFNPPPASHLAEFQNSYSIEPFDWGVIATALAPELSLRYERVYGYLQDDVTRRRPTINLVLDLLCVSEEERLRARSKFSSESSIMRQRIVRLQPDPACSFAPFLSHVVTLEEWAVRTLLQDKGIDRRLTRSCRLLESLETQEEVSTQDTTAAAVVSLLISAIAKQKPLVIFLRSKSALQSRRAAELAVGKCCQRLLRADFSCISSNEFGMEQWFELVMREASLQAAIPFFEDIVEEQQALLARIVGAAGGVAIVAGEKDSVFPGTESCTVVTVDVPALELHERRDLWVERIAHDGRRVEEETVDALASRFKFTPEQITQAVREGFTRSNGHHSTMALLSNSADSVERQADALFTAARAQCGHPIAKLARKLSPKNTWNDLVLPEEVFGQLREFCARLKLSEHIFGTWGFERKLSHGKGTTALFVGPPGTGKTMAAEVIANEIKLDVYKIDLTGIVSKYIGETQKNLDRIFSAAEDANGILFFDEADSLFGKRSEVRDSHDRYANSEVSYLLQKMELYEGAAILATNLSQHMDDAFLRRFAFTIRFPFPEEDCRRRIWKAIWPEQVPLDEEINFDHLASRFRLNGGNIKNVALAAAFFAAEEGRPVTMSHLFRGIEREYQKMGKNISVAVLRSDLERAVLQ